MNKLILTGRTTRPIDVTVTQGGLTIGKTAIAVTRKEEVMFMDITLFGKTAENAVKLMPKGTHVLLEGRVKFEQWRDRNQNTRSKHSLDVDYFELLDPKPTDQTNQTDQGDSEEQHW